MKKYFNGWLEPQAYLLSVINIFSDKDLLSTTMNNVLRLISSPLILICIPLFLSPQIQGFWFSFISIGSLSVFADLGFTNLILQFTAHEFAVLSFDGKRIITGNEEVTARIHKLASLFSFSLKWTGIISVIVFPLIFFIGVQFFDDSTSKVIWILPWGIYMIGVAFTFFNNVILSFIEGCNQVARIQQIRALNAIFFSALIAVTLASGLNLFSISLALIVSSIFTFLCILFYYRPMILQLLERTVTESYHWEKEIFRLLWKFAISFGSGYFIFQIYTPLAFKYFGPEEAGKIGFSMAIWMACFSLANIWLISVLPKMNMLIEIKQWSKLNTLFRQRVIFGTLTYIIMISAVLLVYWLFKDYSFLHARLMTFANLLILSLYWLVQFIVGAWAFYLRAHKEEPYVITSLISAIYIILVTFVIVKYLDSSYILAGLYSAAIIFTPWNYYIFRQKIVKWHNSPSQLK